MKYRLSDPVGPLDASLIHLKNFLSKVVTFGDADGFVTIELTEGVNFPNTCSLPEWWRKDPPDHFLFIHLDGKEEEMTSYLDRTDKEDSKKQKEFHKKLKDPNFKPTKEDSWDSFDNRIYWVISCKATLIAQDSELPVRTGFWTKIVSESLDLAAEKTMSLWLAESKLPDRVKYKKYRHNFKKELDVLLSRMHHDYTLNPLVETIMEYEDSFFRKSKNLDKFKATIDKVSAWKIFNQIKHTEREIKTIKNFLVDKLADKRFEDFYKNEQRLKNNRRKNREKENRVGIPWSEVKKEMKETSKRYKEFLKSLKKK
jgi:hypothetical protein